jgi:hypothetical protein
MPAIPTIGDARLRGYAAAARLCLLAVCSATISVLLTAGPAAAHDASPCGAPVVRSGRSVQYCPLWRGNVPVYADPKQTAPKVGTLVSGGTANWFLGQFRYPNYNYVYQGLYNHWWAYTLSDQGTWGWVSEVFFSGGDNDEKDGALRQLGTF